MIDLDDVDLDKAVEVLFAEFIGNPDVPDAMNALEQIL